MAVPVSLLVSSGLLVVGSAYGSSSLGFVVTLVVSLLFLERVLRPELVDGFFHEVDAVVLGDLRRVRDAIRNEPLTAPIYAAAEERARQARAFLADVIVSLDTEAEAELSGFKDAAVAALLWLRLAAGVANLVATALMNTAFEEARTRAPSVLRWRGVKELRASPPNEEEAAPVSKPGTTLLVVWIAAIFAHSAQALTVGNINKYSIFQLLRMWFPCFAALCGFALMEAERVYLWGSYAMDTTTTSFKQKRRAGDAAGGVKEKKDLQDAWECLWFRTITMHYYDACFVFFLLGNRPFVIVFLAIYNLIGLKAARQDYLTADDADGAQENVSKWRRAALKVLAIDIAKVVSAYILVDFSIGAMLFSSLYSKMRKLAQTASLLDNAFDLSDEGASGDNDDTQQGAGPAGIAGDVAGSGEGTDDDNQDNAGLAGDVARDTENSDDDNHDGIGLPGDVAGDAEGSDDVPADNSSDVTEGSEDVPADNSTDHEEEDGSATEEHSDVSDAEQQRHEESDYSSSSSSSSDGWSFVGVDPIMPTNVNGRADRMFRIFT